MLPTAEEFLSNTSMLNKKLFPKKERDFDQAVDRMKEFAKLHVEAALNKASKEAQLTGDGLYEWVDEDSILNAYPLTNIK